MSKDLHQIDQSFRDAFEHFEATPPELVWDNIATEIKPKKKRRALLFWCLPAVALLFGLSYYNWNLSIENKNLQAKNQNLEQVLADKNNVSTASINDNATTALTESILSSNAFIKKGKKSIFTQKNNSIEKNKIATNGFLQEIKKDQQAFFEPNLKNRKVENLAAIEKITFKTLERERKITFGKKIDCFSFNGKNSNWKKTVEIFAGPEFAPRFLAFKDGEPSNYIGVRDSSENYVVAYSGGIRGTLTHPSGLGLRFGVSAGHLVEQFEYVNKYWKTEVTDPKTGQITTTQGKLTKQIYNRLTTIDFPIQLGFETLNDKKSWNVGIYAGALLNFKFYKSGEIFNPDGDIKRFNDDYAVFNKKVGLSLIGNIRFQRNFGEHWLLGIEPNVTYQLKSLTNVDYSLNQKYIKAGVQIGLAYRF